MNEAAKTCKGRNINTFENLQLRSAANTEDEKHTAEKFSLQNGLYLITIDDIVVGETFSRNVANNLYRDALDQLGIE